MTRLIDTHPELFDNPRLGEVSGTVYLDQVEAQTKEDINARAEGRAPRTVIAEDRYPNSYLNSEGVTSDTKPKLKFEGETEPSPVAKKSESPRSNKKPIKKATPPVAKVSSKPGSGKDDPNKEH